MVLEEEGDPPRVKKTKKSLEKNVPSHATTTKEGFESERKFFGGDVTKKWGKSQLHSTNVGNGV